MKSLASFSSASLFSNSFCQVLALLKVSWNEGCVEFQVMSHSDLEFAARYFLATLSRVQFGGSSLKDHKHQKFAFPCVTIWFNVFDCFGWFPANNL